MGDQDFTIDAATWEAMSPAEREKFATLLAQKKDENPRMSLADIGKANAVYQSLPDKVAESYQGQAQTEAQNAIWNTRADAATAEAAGQGWTGGAGGPEMAVPAYVAAESIKGGSNVFKDKKLTMPQQVALALPTFGLSFLANKFLGRGESHLEEKARAKLAEQGINVPNSGVKEWENNAKFRESRNESDLVGKDIINSASLYSLSGYGGLDAAKQEAVANQALKLGLVREHNGGIDVAANPELSEFVKNQIGSGQSQDSKSSSERKARKKMALERIMPDLQPTFSRAPDYEKNPSSFVRNPYL